MVLNSVDESRELKIESLGSAGGIGNGNFTTCFSVDDRLLLDGGTGVGRLSLEAMNRLELVLITHSHIDHISGLAMMLASLSVDRAAPLKIAAPKPVLDALKQHILNWVIWPDFSKIPNETTPIIEYLELNELEAYESCGYQILPIPVTHTVPSYAYRIEREGKSFCFFGDTGPTDRVWQVLNEQPVSDLFVELSYTQNMDALAAISGHYTTASIVEDLAKLARPVRIHLMHFKPGIESAIMDEFVQISQGIIHTYDLCADNPELVIE